MTNARKRYHYVRGRKRNRQKEKNKNKALKMKGIYEYVNNLNPPTEPTTHIPYRILVKQSELFIEEITLLSENIFHPGVNPLLSI